MIHYAENFSKTSQTRFKMTITRSDCCYYIKEIKDLAKNFDDKTEQQINNKAKSITASKLKELYDELMDYVYGDGGIKGY